MSSLLLPWQPPAPACAPTALGPFLTALGGPRWFTLPGADRSRCRAIVTLLHGNEPSGTLALLRMLREGYRPAVDLWCCVVNVDAALASPPQRALPGERDQNRCFGPGDAVDDRQGRIAAELRKRLAEEQPEAILDLHNTSGNGPAYGVSVENTPVHRALTALFSGHLMHTGLRLGTLLEGVGDLAPTVTIECGGRNQPEAHEAAYAGLRRYGLGEPITTPRRTIAVHHHPVRVELRPGCRVAYAEAPVAGVDVTLRPDVDATNFAVMGPGRVVAWLGERGIDAVFVRGEDDRDRTHELFVQRGNELAARVPFKPLMVTTDADIAASDCLFYAVKLDEEHRG